MKSWKKVFRERCVIAEATRYEGGKKERNKKKRKWTDLIDCASVSTYFSYSSLYRWMFWNEIVFIIFPWEEDEWQMWFGETLKWVFFLSWPETRCIARHLGALTLFTFPSLDYLMEYVHFGNFSKLFEREISRGKVFFSYTPVAVG